VLVVEVVEISRVPEAVAVGEDGVGLGVGGWGRLRRNGSGRGWCGRGRRWRGWGRSWVSGAGSDGEEQGSRAAEHVGRVDEGERGRS
jgi:hypothetical protein